MRAKEWLLLGTVLALMFVAFHYLRPRSCELAKAIDDSDVDKVKALLAQGVPVNKPMNAEDSEYSLIPLIRACEVYHIAVLRKFPRVKQERALEVIKAHLDAGADPNIDGRRPLMAINFHQPGVKLLISRGARVDFRLSDGDDLPDSTYIGYFIDTITDPTELEFFPIENKLEVFKTIIDAASAKELNSHNGLGFYALSKISREAIYNIDTYLDMFEYLIKSGKIDIKADRDDWGYFVFCNVLAWPDNYIDKGIKLLVDNGICINQVYYQKTLLDTAIQDKVAPSHIKFMRSLGAKTFQELDKEFMMKEALDFWAAHEKPQKTDDGKAKTQDKEPNRCSTPPPPRHQSNHSPPPPKKRLQ